MITWIKFYLNFFEDEKVRIMLSRSDGITIIYILFRLFVLSGKTNDDGLIYVCEGVPYNSETLSVIFGVDEDIIKKALKLFTSLRIIEIDEEQCIRIINWEKHQNVEAMKKVREQTRKRVQKYRKKKKEQEAKDEFDFLSSNDDIDSDTKEDRYNNEAIFSDVRKPALTSESKGTSAQKISNIYVTAEKKEEEFEKKIKNKTEDKEKEEIDCRHNDILKKQCDDLASLMSFVNELGINIKGFTEKEAELLLKVHEMQYVKLAVLKAVELKKISLGYIKGILNNWKSEGYPENSNVCNADNGTLKVTAQKPALRFNNFKPREYDYDKLEKQLLGWQSEDMG